METINQFLTQANPLEFAVFTTFLVSFMAMAGGALFFMLERNNVPDNYREAMSVSAVILFIAAINYFFMENIYLNRILSGDKVFPTIFRYIDWVLTTPLMLIKFPVLLGLGPRGRKFLGQLVALDLVMIISGFFGELFVNTPALHYGLFALASVCWVIIVWKILNAVKYLPDWIDPHTASCVRLMSKFILFGWLIYPIGYLIPSTGLPAEVRELLYNIGDIVNKVGLAMVVYASAWALKSKLEKKA